MASPWMIAHRGASADCPENTLVAFDRALTAPIDAIELDLQRSADGVPVVYHDRTLKKLGLPRRRVAGLTLAELQRLDAGSWFDPAFEGTRLTTLDTVLSRYGGKVPLMLEIKQRGGERAAGTHRKLARQVVERVLATGLSDRVFILCFGMDLLHDCIAHAPSLRYVWNLEVPPEMTRKTAARMAPLTALCCRINTLTRRFVAWAHGQGKMVLCYTVNDADAVTRALDAGVDGLISDRPAWLASHMKTRTE